MQKVQSKNVRAIAEVNAHLAKWPHGHKELSHRASIDYWAARRALKYGIKNDTKLFADLCTFFEIKIKTANKDSHPTFESLTETLRETWDGTLPHAELLQNLIKSTKPFKVRERSD